MTKSEISKYIKLQAAGLGFSACGIAPAELLKEELSHLFSYIEKQHYASMDYLARQPENRCDPRKIMDNAKSVVVCSLSYKHKTENRNNTYKISRYAHGTDYHLVLRNKLKTLAGNLSAFTQSNNLRVFVDSAPLLEKAWAQKAGIGWIGKNTLLVNEKYGSYCFLGIIVMDVETEYDNAAQNQCAGCSKCIKACPTQALIAPYALDARKCLSYLTIEHKGPVQKTAGIKNPGWIFGCDVCQEVCPFNKTAELSKEEAFLPQGTLLNLSNNDWENLNSETFAGINKNSSLKRISLEKIQQNISWVKNINNQ